MRRWAWRGVLAVAVVTLTLGGLVGVRAFNRACDGSLEGLRYLSNVRAQLASATAPARPALTSAPSPATAPQPAPAPEPPPTLVQQARAVASRAGDAALAGLIRIKQHDAVAYPAHIAAAHALDMAGCGKDAVRLQWLKAGLHASTHGQIEGVASALVAHASDADDLADLRRVVRTWAERAPLSDSLRRVLAALDARTT